MLDAPICNMSRRAQRDPWKCMQLLNWRFEQTEEIAHKTADVRCLKYVWSSIQTNHQVGATWPNTLRTQSNTHFSCHNVCQLEYCSLMNICVCALDRSIECVCFCIKLRLLHCSFVLLFITHTHTLLWNFINPAAAVHPWSKSCSFSKCPDLLPAHRFLRVEAGLRVTTRPTARARELGVRAGSLCLC